MFDRVCDNDLSAGAFRVVRKQTTGIISRERKRGEFVLTHKFAPCVCDDISVFACAVCRRRRRRPEALQLNPLGLRKTKEEAAALVTFLGTLIYISLLAHLQAKLIQNLENVTL